MTLLVRNEIDVVSANIRYHLEHGADFILVTDNGSTDGTRDILEEYSRQGVVSVIDEPSRVFDQKAWVNRMGLIAMEQFGANILIHCDADEIWQPRSGSLKTEIARYPAPTALSVEVINLLLADRMDTEKFPDDIQYQVCSPIAKPLATVMREVDEKSFLLYRHPAKVIYSLTDSYIEVNQGNHGIVSPHGKKRVKVSRSNDIRILHLPVRSKSQFIKKTRNNGEGIDNFAIHQKPGAVEAWHVKRWYALYKQGRLEEEYRRLLISREDAARLIKLGRISVVDDSAQQVLRYFS